MTLIKLSLVILGWTAAVSGQSTPVQTPLATAPKVEVKGTIERIQITPGQGMPFLELKTDKGTQRVMLGSMRYLMEQNFKPKAGNAAVVKGFLVNDIVVARSVEIPAEKVSIQLRDENGVPLWRMGMWRRGRSNE